MAWSDAADARRAVKIMLGNRAVGDGEACFVIAEAGSNHNGSLTQAKQLIDVAAAAGADAVKFQTFRAAKLYTPRAGTSDYLGLERPIYDIIADMEMPYEWIPELADHCRRRAVQFLSSAFDEESVDRVEPFVTGFKIASYEMNHLPLVRHVAAKGKPMIVSTGTADLGEVATTVAALRAAGNDHLVLLQCIASYPAPIESLNLRVIQTFMTTFGVPAGLSDHSADPLVGPMAAVALGASVIEKHFTLDRGLPGPDHRFAVEPEELGLMIRKIREVESALGSGAKDVHPVERALRSFARRSIFATRPIARGEAFSSENVAVLRCGKIAGTLQPDDFPRLLTRRAARNVAAGAPIQPSDYE
jgi:N-acetylneuraminate synthase